ncbi:hypothetical protein IL306_009124 [Fusarium sp. DS 682]|nr:hypothetical protein IL306_009124 [Fusarium sp. DS 682]
MHKFGLMTLAASVLATGVTAASNTGPFSLYRWKMTHGMPLPTQQVMPKDVIPPGPTYTFVVPGPSSSSHSVRLVKSTSSADGYVSDLMFYGTFVMVEENGEMASLWYATPSEIDGVYSIGWNATDAGHSDDKLVITLKKTPPSNPDHRSQ